MLVNSAVSKIIASRFSGKIQNRKDILLKEKKEEKKIERESAEKVFMQYINSVFLNKKSEALAITYKDLLEDYVKNVNNSKQHHEYIVNNFIPSEMDKADHALSRMGRIFSKKFREKPLERINVSMKEGIYPGSGVYYRVFYKLTPFGKKILNFE